jgi:hypothetical protein
LTKLLLQSRHLNTLCWILELFYMMSWKYSPKGELQNNDLRKELHTQIRAVLMSLSEICTERSKNEYRLISLDLKASLVV